MQDERRRPASLELDRLVVYETRRGVDGALGDGRALAKVWILDDRDVAGLELDRGEERLEHDPRRAVLARDAYFLALEVGRGLDPGRRLAENDRRKLAIDRREVADRDLVADGRDDARSVGQADIDRALADERDEIRIDLVLEGHGACWAT